LTPLFLRTLDWITSTSSLIAHFRSPDAVPDIDHAPLDDDPTLALLRRGDSIGVFQLEGGPMRALMRSLAPTSFEDVAALVALYRPGPMAANMHNDYADRKNGRKPVELFHTDASDLLADTYGLMIYQESMMRISQQFAGYSLADADNLRKACGKKSRAVMAKEKDKFVAGCEATGYGSALGEKLFSTIEQFADYAFNKSHSYGYGFIAFQTAYLKAHFPVEYLAALLTSVKSSLEKAAVYLAECRAMGIQVLVPDVNRSKSDFVPARLDDGTEVIPFGLSAVRNVGEGLVELILAERDEHGPFRDFYDFCDRVDMQVLNKRTIESLIKAGGFDSMGHPRRGLLAVFEEIIDKTVARRREHDMGVMTLFGESSGSGVAYDDRPLIDLDEFDKKERLAFEKEMLGLYVSDHPLLGAEGALRRRTDGTLADALEHDEGSIKAYGGVITTLQRKWTKAGDLMAVFTLEDLQGAMEVMVFPKTMAVVGHKLNDDVVVVVKGKLDKRDDQPKLIAMDVEVFDGVGDGAPPVRIKLPTSVSDQLVLRLRALISEHPGESPVFLHIGQQVVRLADRDCVDVGGGFVGEVRVLFGAECLL
jgi:DNA polymerase-3 subunit alpha